MIPQIIGTKKSARYRQCVRYCKERKIAFQERDPVEKPLSPKELDALARACGGYETLVDQESTVFQKRGLAWMDYDPREELLENPGLLRVPVVRSDKGAAVNPSDDVLRDLLA